MKSKVIVITGTSGGIGAAAARRLADRGHHVVVVGRQGTKTAAVGQELKTEHFVADFTVLSDVRALAKRLLETYPRIDVLVHNASTFFSRKRRITGDGHEVMFQGNYLAGFLLTRLLIDRLIESRATVICASSMTNRFGNIDLDDLENERHYSATKAYCNSKLAQVMFARELHRRYGRRGLGTAAFNPGNVASRLFHHAGSVLRRLGCGPIGGLGAVSPEPGADTLVFLAEGRPEVDFPSGQYFVGCKVAKPNKQAYERILAYDLCNRSEAMLEDVAVAGRVAEAAPLTSSNVTAALYPKPQSPLTA